MLFKRGSTISAAEGGCQAEVGGMSQFRLTYSERMTREPAFVVACSMASAGFAACMGGLCSNRARCMIYTDAGPVASPETILQAAEIGIG